MAQKVVELDRAEGLSDECYVKLKPSSSRPRNYQEVFLSSQLLPKPQPT